MANFALMRISIRPPVEDPDKSSFRPASLSSPIKGPSEKGPSTKQAEKTLTDKPRGLAPLNTKSTNTCWSLTYQAFGHEKIYVYFRSLGGSRPPDPPGWREPSRERKTISNIGQRPATLSLDAFPASEKRGMFGNGIAWKSNRPAGLNRKPTHGNPKSN